ncbi:MAG: cupin domain-containing protein [bacterium]
MSEQPRYIVRHLKDLKKERSTCGFRKRFFTVEDNDVMSASYVSINDAKPHYHKKTTELYYVLEGEGTLEMDGNTVPVSVGSAILIPPMVQHRATGNIVALVVGDPPFHADDLFLVDG